MKKLFYLLFVLPLAFFASCDDDDNLPNVDFTVTLSNVSQLDNMYYVVKGDSLVVDGLSVKSLTGQAATVTGVRYLLDGFPLTYPSIVYPFSVKINTANLSPAVYDLGIQCTVLQVDKSICNTAVGVPFTVVESIDKLPSGAPEKGTFSTTFRIQPKK